MTRPSNPSNDTSDDLAGNGVEAGVVLVIFAGCGYLLDRWLGTTPIFVIGLFLVGAVGLFYKFKVTYDHAMDAHERSRTDTLRSTGPGQGTTP